jgi:hypothetical protein
MYYQTLFTLPCASESGDNRWQPTSQRTSRLWQMGQLSVMSRDFLDNSNASWVAWQSGCGLPDLRGGSADVAEVDIGGTNIDFTSSSTAAAVLKLSMPSYVSCVVIVTMT